MQMNNLNINPTSTKIVLFIVIILALIALLAFIAVGHELIWSDYNIKLDANKSIEVHMSDTKKYSQLYSQWTMQENIRVFEWHLRSTKILFGTSILIAIMGMGFSFWQFHEAAESQRISREVEEIEIKTQMISLALKSRSMASLLLFVSIVYIISYSIFVYPLKVMPDYAVSENEISKENDRPKDVMKVQDSESIFESDSASISNQTVYGSVENNESDSVSTSTQMGIDND